MWAVRRRPENTIDLWDGRTYRRVLVLAGQPTEARVTQSAAGERPKVSVTIRGERLDAGTVAGATAALERLLGLRVDLGDFYRLAAADPRLGPLAERLQGLKPPRFPSPFEALVNAIACQQITLTLGIRILGRLAAVYGAAMGSSAGVLHALPGPGQVVGFEEGQLREISFSRQKTRALVEAGRAVVEGRLDFDSLETQENGAASASLLALRGVGRWTAEYVLLRGLGRLNVFPWGDVGARNNLQRWLGLPSPLDDPAAQEIVAAWQPYAGLVYFHLLLDRLAEAGRFEL